MNDRILIDTNILLDMAISGRVGHEAAVELARRIADGKAEALICATSLKDVYYILTKHMGEADARLYTRSVMDAFCVCTIDLPICRQAVDSDEPDFEDGLIRACAEQKKADFIITRDAEAFTRSRIKALDADGYLAIA